MNKNKIIFGIIAAILGIFLFIGISALGGSSTKKTGSVGPSGVFRVWILQDDSSKFREYVNTFQKQFPEYGNIPFEIESFSDYESYYLALASAFTKGQGPDIFVLNNGEKLSVYDDQILGISPSVINPNDFRQDFKGVFGDDLIRTYEEDGVLKEYLVGVPLGYESLGIFFNRFVKPEELESFSSLNNAIERLKKRNPDLVPIAIGNGSTVYGVADIITQFFLLEPGIQAIADVVGNKAKQSLAFYFLFGDDSGKNAYNKRFAEMQVTGKNNLDLFSKGETFMVVGYPRLINEIHKRGYVKGLLKAKPFPHYFGGNGTTLINYNYFVVSKDSSNTPLAMDFLQYMTSNKGASEYFNIFPYYFPALLSLESEQSEQKIHPDYYIALKHMYNPEHELVSFDRGIKSIYDREIISILDNDSNFQNAFAQFQQRLICSTKKMRTLENLSVSCR